MSVKCAAQVGDSIWVVPESQHYAFVNTDANVFNDAPFLDSFYAKLQMLHRTGKGRVNIIHIGDSHLQADGLTSVVRNGLQAFFGDAGRGLVFPYQLAGSNAPLDIKAASGATWKSNKVISPDKPLQPGISGYVIQSNTGHSNIQMRFQEREGIRCQFDRLTFFMTGFGDKFTIRDSANPEPVTFSRDITRSAQQVDLPSSSYDFEMQRTAEKNDEFQFYGVSLEKREKAGVLYHTIGVNGARYDQYLQCPLFWEQLGQLHGDLVIISLGTNEAQNPYLQQLPVNTACDSFVNRIKRIMPNACIIVTVPAGSYYQGKKPNKSLVTVQAALKQAAQENRAACWDLFKITGGMEKIPEWKKNNLLAHDLVHYTTAGYSLQGSLLLQAICTQYNRYNKTHLWKPITKPEVLPVKKNPQVITNEVVKAPIVKKASTSPVNTPPATVSKPVQAPPARDTSHVNVEQPKRKSNIIVEYSN